MPTYNTIQNQRLTYDEMVALLKSMYPGGEIDGELYINGCAVIDCPMDAMPFSAPSKDSPGHIFGFPIGVDAIVHMERCIFYGKKDEKRPLTRRFWGKYTLFNPGASGFDNEK